MTESTFDQGLALHQAGRLDEAAQRYREVLRGEPAHLNALHMLGVICVQTRRPERGADLIARAIEIDGSDASAHVNLAAAQLMLGRLDAALASYDTALALQPDAAQTEFDRANVLVRLERCEEAVAGFDAALALRPDHLETHNNRVVALFMLRRFEAVLSGCDRAIALKPDAPEAHSNRAAALNQLGRPDEALASAKTALALRPDYAEARHNLANAELSLERPEAALAGFRVAMGLKPDKADPHNGAGLALYALRRPAEALTAYDIALAIAPDHAEAHFNRATARLALGDLPGGFDDYRWRWRLPAGRLRVPELPCPLWEGEPLAGKAILVHCEQGFGDSLQFIRYAPMLAAQAARVTVRADPALVTLFQSMPGIEVASDFDPAAYDVHIPLLDIPRVLATTLATIPGETPYLAADPDKAARWAARLGELPPGLRVGLVWAGKSRAHDPAAHAIDRRRSLALAQLAPLGAVPGVQLISLQLGDPAAETAAPSAGLSLLDPTADLHDFSDTAALIAGLDLLISVDTSVAHLAGALGKPVWILSRFDGCWRWLNGRDDSPWYPTARLFHQRTRGDWAEVIGRVVGELGRRAAAR